MKASKKIVALSVFCLMIFNTVSVFAADRDVWEKATDTKFATRMEMRQDKAKILKVRQRPVDYYFEANGHLFEMKTMYQEFAKDKLNFVTKLVKGNSDVKPVPADELKVVSVSAINLAQMKVVFNKAVDKTTAEDLANYVLTTAGTAVVSGANGEATLQEDQKTVMIDLHVQATNQEKTELKIKNIKDLNKKKIEESDHKVEFFDVALPVAEKVELSGSKTLKVTFSEPVQDGGVGQKIKIDGGKYSDPTASFVPAKSGREVMTLTLTSALPVGEHTLTIEGVKDYANFASVSKDFKFDYKKDDAAPTVSVKEIKSDAKTVILQFSKDIDSTKLVNNMKVEFSHTYKGANAVDGTAVTKITDSEYKLVFVQPLAPGNTNIFVAYKAGTTDAQKVKDLFGNILVLPVTLPVNVEADTTAPTVEKVEATKADEIEVTFSEDVDLVTAQNIANYKLTNADNAVVELKTAVYVPNDLKATVTTKKALKAGEYKLEIKNIKDKAVVANTIATVTKDLSVADKVAPKVNSVVYDATTKKIVVKFDKNMAAEGLNDLANYALTVNGASAAFPSGTTVSVKDQKTVEITLSKKVENLDGLAGDFLQVSGKLKDTANNEIGGMSVSVEIDPAASIQPKLVADSAAFVDVQTITLEVDTELKAIDKTQIEYDSVQVKAASYENKGIKALLTITVADANKLTATDSTGFADLKLKANALTSSFGATNAAPINVVAANIADEVAPFIAATSEMTDIDYNGQIDQVKVVFSEKVLAGSVQASDFTLSDGYTVKDVLSVNGKEVTLSLNEQGTPDTGIKLSIALSGEIKDMQDNAVDSGENVELKDKAAPVLLSATYKDGATPVTFGEIGDSITFKYSEKIVQSFGAADATKAEFDAEFDLVDGGADNAFNGGDDTAIALAGGTVMTHTVTEDTLKFVVKTTDFATLGTVANNIFVKATKAGAKIKDANGNNQVAMPGYGLEVIAE